MEGKEKLEMRRQASETLSELIVSKRVVEMEINPAMAEEMLALAGPNRNLSERAVQRYARDVAAGAWKQNAETIKFDDNGNLMDGQHRLRAVVRADKPIVAMVAFGISRDAMSTIDCGLRRSVAHALSINGEQNVNPLSGAINIIHAYLAKQMGERTEPLTFAQAEAVLVEHPTIRDSVCEMNQLGTRRLFRSAAAAVAIHWILSRIDRAKAAEFIGRLTSGAGLDERSPILKLRNWLTQTGSSRAKVERDLILAYTFKAWNLFVTGKQIAQLSVKQAERFPYPVAPKQAKQQLRLDDKEGTR